MSKKYIVLTTFLAFVVLIGICVFLYLIIQQLWFERNASIKVQQIVESSADYTQEEQESEYERANNYNDQFFKPLKGSAKEYFQSYYDIFDFGDGVMGSIEIPSIDVELPIYHGTTEETLLKGAGHYEYSSLPTGELNTHSIITAHCGLPEAELFTNLSKLKIGDKFSITVMNITTEYTVDDISVVKPEEVCDVDWAEDKCYVSLVTCTPYRINTHRLVVRGIKSDTIDNISEIQVKETTADVSQDIKNSDTLIVIGAFVFFGAASVTIFVVRKRKNDYEKKTD